MSKRIIIAIDGPAGAGKSTIARHVARRLGFVYIDTGAMYRALALWAMRSGIQGEDMQSLEQLALNAEIHFEAGSDRVLLNQEDVTGLIRTAEISAAASQVAAVPGVRRAMVAIQREIAEEASVVMEGRDIGSVVFPDAEIKIYLDAMPEIRARRRASDLHAVGTPVDLDELTQQIAERDARDRNRSTSPLIQAPDATYIDTSDLSPEEVEDRILALIRHKTSNGKELVH
jgi:CMP/dCMP kinase